MSMSSSCSLLGCCWFLISSWRTSICVRSPIFTSAMHQQYPEDWIWLEILFWSSLASLLFWLNCRVLCQIWESKTLSCIMPATGGNCHWLNLSFAILQWIYSLTCLGTQIPSSLAICMFSSYQGLRCLLQCLIWTRELWSFATWVLTRIWTLYPSA